MTTKLSEIEIEVYVSKKNIKIFLCSMYSDLITERASLLRIIAQLQLLHASMEFFGARPETPLETVLDEVRSSDIVVVIIGHRYGTLVPGRRVSYTEIEYKEAWKTKKPCLVYVRSDDSPILPSQMEKELSKIRSLERFKNLIYSRHHIAAFSKVDDLALKFAIDVERTIKTIKHESDIESPDSTLSLLDFLDTPSFLCDADNKILEVNKTFTKILGYKSSEMIRKPILSFISKKKSAKQIDFNNFQLASSNIRNTDIVFKKKNRGIIYFELDVHKYESRGVVIIQCVAHDVTERKKTEEALRISEANLMEKIALLENVIGININDLETMDKRVNPLDEVLSQAERAYAAYMDAERQVAKAYHENEVQVWIAYQRAEKKSMNELEKSLAQAEVIRDEALRKSPTSHQQIITIFDETVKQALANHNISLERASDVRTETVNQAWEIYSKISS